MVDLRAMVFSTPIFIFLFLPIALTVYFLLPRKFRNVWILIASLFFYAWGEPVYLGLMVFSIIFNYFFGRIIASSAGWKRKFIFVLDILLNLSLIGFFKYSGFIVDSLNGILEPLGVGAIEFTSVPLPIGISFYTFMAISYIIDVYSKKLKVEKKRYWTGMQQKKI